MILSSNSGPPERIKLVTPVRQLKGLTRAVLCDCDDGRSYVVKGKQVQRPLVADYVVGKMGELIGAPVPPVRLIEVPNILIMPGTMLEGFEAGVGHGSAFMSGCSDAYDVRYPEDGDNRDRYAALAVLFGWADCEDRQYLLATSPPHSVWAIDFGMFFCGTDEWSVESLANAHEADIDRLVASAALVAPADLAPLLARLAGVTDNQIGQIVSEPPDEWGVSLDDRIGLAKYLASRRDQLVARF